MTVKVKTDSEFINYLTQNRTPSSKRTPSIELFPESPASTRPRISSIDLNSNENSITDSNTMNEGFVFSPRTSVEHLEPETTEIVSSELLSRQLTIDQTTNAEVQPSTSHNAVSLRLIYIYLFKNNFLRLFTQKNPKRCRKCGGTDHVRSNHHLCLYYKKKQQCESCGSFNHLRPTSKNCPNNIKKTDLNNVNI